MKVLLHCQDRHTRLVPFSLLDHQAFQGSCSVH
jgi:hypothetical protein